MLRSIVVLGIATSASGCVAFDMLLAKDCIEYDENTIEMKGPPDAPLQFRLDRCELDASACNDVCTLALQRAGMSNTVSSCKVARNGDDVLATATFEVANNCVVPSGDDVLVDSPPPTPTR